MNSTLSERDIYAQERGKCGEACLIAAIGRIQHQINSREDFLNKSRSIDKLFGGYKSQSPKNLTDFQNVWRSIFGRESAVKCSQKLKVPCEGLALFRLEWGRRAASNSPHLLYDEEHYVLVYRMTNTHAYFWEPSFGWNFPCEQRKLARDSMWLGNGEPFWNMPKDEFFERNSSLQFVPENNGKFLALF